MISECYRLLDASHTARDASTEDGLAKLALATSKALPQEGLARLEVQYRWYLGGEDGLEKGRVGSRESPLKKGRRPE